jgi:hypothetical protein
MTVIGGDPKPETYDGGGMMMTRGEGEREGNDGITREPVEFERDDCCGT